MWQVIFHPGAERELQVLPTREKVAIMTAVKKLQALGPALPFPHQSDIRGAEHLRELRPRGGRSAWRAFYRRIGDKFVIAAVGPEAGVNRRAFGRAVRNAESRLRGIESEGDEV